MQTSWRESDRLTTGEVARRCGVSLWRVLRALRQGEIPEPPRVGQLRCWRAEDVERALAAFARGAA